MKCFIFIKKTFVKYYRLVIEFHSEARYHLFDEIQRHQHTSHNLSPENLYQCVMTSKSEKVLAAIAKFTYFGFKRRDKFEIILPRVDI